MKILALDVGVVTGVAIAQGDDVYQTFIIKTLQEAWSLVTMTDWDVIVYESFQAVMISGYGLHTVQLIGGIRALAWSKQIKCVCQSPQARYSRIEDAKKILAKRNQAYAKHQLDALAHLLVYENAIKGVSV